MPTSMKMTVSLLALLALLAVLQYQWLGQVSRAEQERMRATLRSAVNRFAEDFDREIARAFVYFRLTPIASGAAEETQLVERFRLWNEEAPYPDLLEDVLLAQPNDQGGFEWKRLDPAAGRFHTVDESSASRWGARLRNAASARRRGREPTPFLIIEEVPAVAIPIPARPEGFPPEALRPGERRARPRPPTREPGPLVVLQFDLSFVQKEWLPVLASRYFARGGELDFELVVFRSAEPEDVVFQSDPASRFRTGDASARIFGSVPFEELRHLWVETGLGREGFRRIPGGRPAPPQPTPTFEDGARSEAGAWQLVVRHRAGSLEAAVSAARSRNLAVSLGILALLAVSMVMLLLSTQRAQQLARQQMEFVAGVTHELQTPLAVIRSAGQNLADGVVETTGQVKEYGSLIAKEGRRLSGMVDQVLEFAGLQSRGRSDERVVVELDRVIDTALADCEPAISEAGIRVEKIIEPDLPRLKADPSALRRALQNLIDNAVKYGADGKWIGIEARRSGDGAKAAIEISVGDRGPGIAPADLPHVFEPFYRGSHTQPGLAKEARGSGLGLSLVQQIVQGHGGRVTVRSSEAEGTVLTIHLPAEAPAE